VERQCKYLPAGQAECFNYKTLRRCTDSGGLVEEPCGEGSTCAAGACRNAGCVEGEKQCGYRAVATCNASGTWDEEKCAGEEICIANACSAQTCSPGAMECKDEVTAQVCRTDGTGWIEAGCAAGQSCLTAYGVCQAALCSPPTDPGADAATGEGDASGDVSEDTSAPEDTAPSVELEPLDTGEVVIDGEKIVFTSNKSATYVESDSDLRISMDKGQMKIEISLSPLEEFDVGQWSSASPGDVNVMVLYHDGSQLTGNAQFRYVSVDYEFELLKFQAKGGRIKGTFSGTFTDDGGLTTVPFTNGVFDVKRHD
jgi:hypothetical protein